MFTIAQIIGFIALAFNVSTFQAKRHRTMMSLQIVVATLYSVHFFMLGALTGAALAVAGLIRSIVFRKVVPINATKRSLWPLLITQAIGLIAAIVTWQDWRSLLALVGWQAMTLAFWQRREQRVRQFGLASSPPWLIYDLLYGSMAGVLNEVLCSSSVIVGLWRFRKKSSSGF